MNTSVELNQGLGIAELFHAGHKESDCAPRTVHRIVSNLMQGKHFERKA